VLLVLSNRQAQPAAVRILTPGAPSSLSIPGKTGTEIPLAPAALSRGLRVQASGPIVAAWVVQRHGQVTSGYGRPARG
jgi:hypothetical protein